MLVEWGNPVFAMTTNPDGGGHDPGESERVYEKARYTMRRLFLSTLLVIGTTPKPLAH